MTPAEFEQDINCPHCGRLHQLHSAAAGKSAAPSDGAVSICWDCRKFAIFINGPAGLGLRLPTPEELGGIEADKDIRRVLAAMAESYTPGQAVRLSLYRRGAS